MQTNEIIIEENSPRDGIQNESTILGINERISLIDSLSECGFKRIQIGSFVHPRLVPQMAETEKVFEGINRRAGIIYSALIFNDQGLQRAVSAGLEHVSLFVSASETHSRRNSNCSIQEALDRTVKLISIAKKRGLTVQAGVMNAFGCRFEGAVPPDRVIRIIQSFTTCGADEINLADTSGIGHPMQVEDLVKRARDVSLAPLALHLHDTFGFGLANVYAAWKAGIRRFDASCGGLGGCPFIPDAAGNIPSEDMVYFFEKMGVTTGVSLCRLATVVKSLESRLRRRLPGRYARICPENCD